MPFNDYFIFNGQKSSDFGLWIASDPHAIHPARRGDGFTVPGRNGVIVREDGSYDTYTQVYDVFIDSNSEGIYERARRIAEWLLGSRGFCRLEDSFEPLYFRSARCAAQLDIENRLTRFGRAQIAFECQPQRFLKSGESSLISERVYPYDNLDIFEQTLTIHPIPANTKKVTLIVKQDAEEENCDGSLRIAGSSGSGRSATMVEIPGEGDADGISEYSGTLYVGESEINSGKNIIVKQIGSDSQNTFFDFIGNVLLYDADNKVIEQYITSGRKLNVFNKTEHESRPLIKVTGTKKNQAAPVSQSLTMSRYYWIGSGGEIVQVASGSFYVSLTVSVTGYAYAYIKGVGYVFTDINGKTRKGGFEPTGKEINKKVIIPSWATGVRVSQILDADPNYSVPASLSLQEAAPNPTTAVATINSTTINLNFSTYSTIYLDCDLHDAYYEDGSSANSAVSFSSTVTDYPTFPGLVPELNLINISSEDSITFEIVPRWWVL